MTPSRKGNYPENCEVNPAETPVSVGLGKLHGTTDWWSKKRKSLALNQLVLVRVKTVLAIEHNREKLCHPKPDEHGA